MKSARLRALYRPFVEVLELIGGVAGCLGDIPNPQPVPHVRRTDGLLCSDLFDELRADLPLWSAVAEHAVSGSGAGEPAWFATLAATPPFTKRGPRARYPSSTAPFTSTTRR